MGRAAGKPLVLVSRFLTNPNLETGTTGKQQIHYYNIYLLFRKASRVYKSPDFILDFVTILNKLLSMCEELREHHLQDKTWDK